MSGLSKLRLIGIGWSVVVGGLLFWLDRAQQPAIFLGAIVMFVAGWLMLLTQAGRVLAPVADAGLLAETGATLSRCSQAFGGQFDAMRIELLRVQQLLTEAIASLLVSFQVLSDQSVSPLAGPVGQNVEQAIVGLQFQDVVMQLIGHVSKRLDELHGIMREIEGASVLVENHSAGGFSPEQAERLRTHLNLALSRLDQLHDNTGNSPVRQERFGSGDVVLF
jgi:hypothetical protein